MIKYLKGYITSSEIPGETTLRIFLTDSEGKNLEEHIQVILNTYSRHISCIEFVDGEKYGFDLISMFQIIHGAKLKTAWKTSIQDESQIPERLNDVLDYLWIKNMLHKKEYSPFGDATVWLEI